MQLEVKELRNPDILCSKVPLFTAAQQGNYSALTPTDGFGDIISSEH